MYLETLSHGQQSYSWRLLNFKDKSWKIPKRKCSLWAISLFATMYQKSSYAGSDILFEPFIHIQDICIRQLWKHKGQTIYKWTYYHKKNLKHFGIRSKCALWIISTFNTLFSKVVDSICDKMHLHVGKGLIRSSIH